jgi:hypothetical protein
LCHFWQRRFQQLAFAPLWYILQRFPEKARMAPADLNYGQIAV